ncbi:tetratricopeptide repeat protein [Pseudomonas sp. PCH446]
MFKKIYCFVVLMLTILVSVVSEASDGVQQIEGFNGSLLKFDGWDKKHGGWLSVEYKSEGGGFRLYDLPVVDPLPGFGIIATSNAEALSPDKKIIMLQRTQFGLVTNEQGQEVNSEHTSCDALSLVDGCIAYSGSAEKCSGVWMGDKWKVDGGDVLNLSAPPIPPRSLIGQMSGSSPEERVDGLEAYMFMGVGSYMSCYPPARNISEFNDIGFYFAQGGEHRIAMEVYRRLLKVAPDRIPLKLNVADSLWALGQIDEAKSFYKSYNDAMFKKRGADKIPKRVSDRLK